MAEPKLTGFLISLTVFGFFIGIFGLFYSDISEKYGTDYDNESLDVYNKLEEMHTEAETYQDNIEEVGGEKNFLEKGVDIFGGLFSAGLSSVKIVFKSVEVFLGMADSAETELGKAGLGATAGYLRIMIGSVVLILLFVGILLPVILRWGKKL